MVDCSVGDTVGFDDGYLVGNGDGEFVGSSLSVMVVDVVEVNSVGSSVFMLSSHDLSVALSVHCVLLLASMMHHDP